MLDIRNANANREPKKGDTDAFVQKLVHKLTNFVVRFHDTVSVCFQVDIMTTAAVCWG